MKDTKTKVKVKTFDVCLSDGHFFHKFMYDCTDSVNELLGGLVKKAYIEVGDDCYGSDDDCKSYAKMTAENIAKEYARSKRLNFDSSFIYIEFNNGKKIKLNNSEWGSIAGWSGDFT